MKSPSGLVGQRSGDRAFASGDLHHHNLRHLLRAMRALRAQRAKPGAADALPGGGVSACASRLDRAHPVQPLVPSSLALPEEISLPALAENQPFLLAGSRATLASWNFAELPAPSPVITKGAASPSPAPSSPSTACRTDSLYEGASAHQRHSLCTHVLCWPTLLLPLSQVDIGIPPTHQPPHTPTSHPTNQQANNQPTNQPIIDELID